MSISPGTIGVRVANCSDVQRVVERPDGGELVVLTIDNEREHAYRAKRSSLAVSRRTVVRREARTASVTPRRNGHAQDLGFVAWIHPLNLLQRFSASSRKYSAAPAITPLNSRARLAVVKALASLDPHSRAAALTTNSVERNEWLLRDGRDDYVLEADRWRCARKEFLAD